MLTGSIRFVPFFLMAAAASLTACGNSNTETALTGMRTIPSLNTGSKSTARPTVTAAASMTYSGSFEQTGRGVTHVTFRIDENVTATAAKYASGAATEYHVAGYETGSGKKIPFSVEAFADEVPSVIRAGRNVELLEVDAHNNGTDERTVFGPGSNVVDQVPEVPQARWTNDAARTQTITNGAAGSFVRDIYHRDGSYRENAIPVEGLRASGEDYADGNAVYNVPLNGGLEDSTATFIPPVKGKLTIALANSTIDRTEWFTERSWYPTPLALAGDTVQDYGSVRIPVQCKVPKRYGSTVTELVELRSRLDIIVGEVEITERALFLAPSYGLLCLLTIDDVSTYYDYETTDFSGSPLMASEAIEALSLQRESGSSRALAAAASAALPLDANLVEWRGMGRMKTTKEIVESLKRMGKAH